MADHPDRGDGRAWRPSGECWRSGRRVLVWSVVVLIVMLVQSRLLERADSWARWSEVAVALAPLAAFAGLFAAMWRHVRGLDEMQQRMQLEALGMTVIGASMICLAFGQLQKVGAFGLVMLDDAWVIIAFTYVAACLIVKLRYR